MLYTREGEYLHGLHEKDSGLERPWGLANSGEKVVVADWSGNKTFIMDFDWAQGRVGDKRQIADVEYPTNFQMTEDRIILLSLVCCQLEDFIKMTIYDVAGNLVTSTTTLPSGDRILAPQDVAVDPQGNILLSDGQLGTVVLSPDLGQQLGELELAAVPDKITFYQDKLYVLVQKETGEDHYDSFISVYKYSI